MNRWMSLPATAWAGHGEPWLQVFSPPLSVNAAGANGLLYGNPMLVVKQLIAILAVWAFTFVVTFAIVKVVQKTMGLRVSKTEETIGLDISQHGERAYGGFLR